MLPRLNGPPGYTRAKSDVPWNPKYLQLEPPERVHLLAELDPSAAGPTALSPMAITTPFRLLSDEGVRILQEICRELEGVSTTTARVSRLARGVAYRSEFIRGLCFDPTVLGSLRRLARAEIEPHPITHHAAQLNFTPEDISCPVDQWHRDAVAFALVLMVSDPRPMKGGRFEYFWGSVEEGKELLRNGRGLPADRVRRAEFPGPGWAVLQQGHRVIHRAAPLEEHYPRITLVASYYAPHPAIDDPTDLGTTRKVDGREIALVEWSRYAALVTARKLQRFAETQARFSSSLDEVRLALHRSIADVEQAIAEFDRTDEGRLISFEPPK